jgi:hypothetical protein
MANEKLKLSIPVSFESKPQENIPLKAFLFNRKGELLESVAISGDKADFKTPITSTRDTRVLIVPAGDERVETATTIADLQRFKPYEPVLNTDLKGNIKAFPIPNNLLKLWKIRFCRVRGNVYKTFSMSGVTQNRPICHARVHICEIDKIWWLLPKIPDYIIKKIPDIILYPDRPIPIPDPGPLHVIDTPGVVIRPDVVTGLHPLTLDVQPLKEAAPRITGAPPVISPAARENVLRTITPEIKQQLLSGNVNSIRNILQNNIQIFHPYFCLIPWIWPYFYRSDEITTVYTDYNGKFDTSIIYWVDGDHPDLYFWVEYFINGVWTTVYKPPIPCYTYWDFACGSEVNIKITDDRVRWECSDVVPGDIVWVKSIGHGASVSRIKQVDDYVTIQGKSLNRIGLSDAVVTLSQVASGDYRQPFGSSLYFLLQFGSGLPSSGVTHYRWSYRKVKEADLSDTGITAYTVLNNLLYKGYTFEYIDGGGHKQFGGNSFKLGPVTVGTTHDLFIIPPTGPAMAPVHAPESSPFWDQNTVSVTFDSKLDGDGLYEFKLELFNATGHLVNVPKASQFFRVPKPDTFSPSILAPDNMLVESGGNVSAYKMLVRIDNQSCKAAVNKIQVLTGPNNYVDAATDCCGFVKYDPAQKGNNSLIKISFQAYHPNNFANFGFVVQKGTCDDAAQKNATNVSGMVIGDAPAGDGIPYSRNVASVFSRTFSPNTLLGICSSGGKGAFAEQLGVSVLTIDGNIRLYSRDASGLAAFALEPA